MRGKLCLFGIIFLFLVSFAYAVPPAQGGDAGLRLGFPDFEWGKIATPFEIPVHVYSLEDGLVQTVDVNCSFHIYNSTGSHIFEGYDDTPSHNYDYEVAINDSVFVSEGYYSLQVYCECSGCSAQSADLGGFVRKEFYITADGMPKNLDGSGGFLWALILIPLIFGLFMLVGSATMNEEHSVLKIFLFLLSVPMVWVSLHFGLIGLIRYYGLSALQDIIGTTTYWMSWLFFVLISYFIIYAIWKAFQVMAQDKEGKMNY